MAENEQECNGVYLNFDCLDALFQLEPEDAMEALKLFFKFRLGEYYFEKAWNSLSCPAQRCAFVMLDRFSKPEA